MGYEADVDLVVSVCSSLEESDLAAATLTLRRVSLEQIEFEQGDGVS